MHARLDNPELVRAKEMNIPVYSFPEFIYQQCKDKIRVVVGGSHGKTTITSMILHVLHQCHRDFDYLVGAQLEGFPQSVKISDAPIMVCEGDEYPASVLEKRPKFHFFAPHIAILSGISWDHINVFPNPEIYLEQFRIFLHKIQQGGVLIYNETDPILKGLVQQEVSGLQIIPYGLPVFSIHEGLTQVIYGSREATLQVFGEHNLLNLQAAKLACQHLGVSEKDFLFSISSFNGASKRLELQIKRDNCLVYRDFAHAPSKLKATILAVKEQYPDKKLLAFFELHTFSSLNPEFQREYKGSMDPADTAVVYFSQHALALKQLPPLETKNILEGFGNNKINVFSKLTDLQDFLAAQSFDQTVLLFMSSGNFDGLDLIGLQQYLN
ncbi:MAG: UDP-N-acetylmuramate--L-alanine ligase, partial [Chitinophagaceae bacterium]